MWQLRPQSQTHKHPPLAQVGPSQPGGHWHSKPEGTSWQVPPLAHGLDTQACSAAKRVPKKMAVTNSAQHCSFDQFQCPRNLIHRMLCSTHLLTYLTVLARVSLRTGAVVLIRLRVYAGASVHAGMVPPTVVQICTGNKNKLHFCP